MKRFLQSGLSIRIQSLRPFFLRSHRWIGLFIAGFLLIAGVTGSLLAWNDELDAAIRPDLFLAAQPMPGAAMLDPFVLRDVVQDAYPGSFAAVVPLRSQAGHALIFRVYPRPDPVTAQTAESDVDQVFVNPYTGTILGDRKWGDLTQGSKNLMPFIYRLHFSLALGVIGSYAFGIVALLWTLDCFIGAYLTFPATRRKKKARSVADVIKPAMREKSWLHRWWSSWRVRWHGGGYKINFDLHRAAGLWFWAMLLVLAWSSVSFNLSEVYKPVMNSLLAVQPDGHSAASTSQGKMQPVLGWHEAHRIGRELMASQARRHEFQILHENRLMHDPRQGVYRYDVKSDRDIRDDGGNTSITFDADTGAFRSIWLPTGAAAGDTFRMWLSSLHMAEVWGLPMKVFICLMGLGVTMLSGTGYLIWLKKRRAQRSARQRI
ncbi:MAG TPA: PepSY-associated TM helix domain-containing protein [Oxalicibacterium sp.]